VSVLRVPGIQCVDQYEVASAPLCPVADVQSPQDTTSNLEEPTCRGVSQVGAQPWSFVSRDQATTLCARSGKRLPSHAEWYEISAAMTGKESDCNLASLQVHRSGARTACVTSDGIYDLVGNLWEWTEGDVIDGRLDGQPLPESGYVRAVLSTGVPYETHSTPVEAYGYDYVWTAPAGLSGIIRGGYYASDSDGGRYSFHAKTPPLSQSAGVGFRCVR
jgi:formylglycine-generating enzyme required for sulfatase activity